ncbi:hypothetical protein ACFE04_004369 [Oxalis oulophora]
MDNNININKSLSSSNPNPNHHHHHSFPPPASPSLSNRSCFANFPITNANPFTHDDNIISGMSDNPPRNKIGHRRAHSEILTLPDDITFDAAAAAAAAAGKIGLVVVPDDGPSFSDENEIDDDLFSMYLDMDSFNSASSATSAFQLGQESSSAAAAAAGMKPRMIRHKHSLSMDGTASTDMLMSGNGDIMLPDSKKAISAAKLAELALVDPKRAKRIWANRQSAARSKERKMRYIADLERKLQKLQTEATSLSAQLTLLQRDTNGLTVENSELKLRVQSMEQQMHLQDALNGALKEEIQHLKVMTGQQMPNALQFQQLQIHSQKQQQHQFQMLLHQQEQQQQAGDFNMMGTSQKDNSAVKD